MSEEIVNYDELKPSWFKNKIKGLKNKYFIKQRALRWNLHIAKNNIKLDYSKIPKTAMPVLINNYNRTHTLNQMVEWLLSLEDEVAIIIVDNQSDYPPLLEYYDNIKHPNVQAVLLNFNSYKHGIEYLANQLVHHDKFMMSDPDLIPYPDTPKDIISHISRLMDKYPNYNHIGPSLEILDIPDDIPVKQKVVKHESQFWSPHAEKLNDEAYVANIDLTLAMYRKSSKYMALGPSLRTDRPYTVQHIDWYVKEEDYTDDFRYYLATTGTFATWAMQIKKEKKVPN